MSWRGRPLFFGLIAAIAVLSATIMARAADIQSQTVSLSGPASRPAGSSLLGFLGRRLRSPSSAPAASAPAEPDSPSTEMIPAEVEVRVDARGTIELHVADADLSSVLRLLGRQSRRNIVASKNVSGKVTADLYDLTIEQVLDAILGANNCGWLIRDHLIHVYTNEELARIEADGHAPVCRVFRLKHVTAEEASKLIQPLLSKDGKVTATSKSLAGVTEGVKEAAGNTLAGEELIMVMDLPDRVEAVAQVIREIDSRPKQVLIEATILRAQLNENNSLGIDFNIVGGVDFAMLNSSSTGVTDLTVGDLPQNRFNDSNYALRQDLTAAVPPGGFTFGIIKNNIATFIRALEQVTDTTVVANPKVLALNKQRGEVIVGRRDGYLTTTVTQTASIQNVEFLETGTQLIFRPFVEDDGYVRMEIHPKDSTGGLTAANLPFEQTTEVTTNITVRDGQTILIGGLFRDVGSSGRSQMPYVGNIPVIGWLFRGQHDSTQREEVIILLTVHLVKDDQDLADQSRKAVEDVERYRVSMRDSLLPYGRERLAQAHYHWAMQHQAKGRLDMALWDARIASHLNPKFLAAIELTEKLSNRRAWDDDGSSVRDFVLKETLKEKGITGPLYERPRREVSAGEPGPQAALSDTGEDAAPAADGK
ncbi:MAG TPA: hypothetical protein VLM89_16060 [Phycisphaerae bacterium]|nr:hypothetical protein [Phycisphaerae bacterium]